jgi:hypothetical protein
VKDIVTQDDLTVLSEDELFDRLDDRSRSKQERQELQDELDRREAIERAAMPVVKANVLELERRINHAAPDAEEAKVELARRQAEWRAQAAENEKRRLAEIAAMTDEALQDRLTHGGYTFADRALMAKELARRGLPERREQQPQPSPGEDEDEAPERTPAPQPQSEEHGSLIASMVEPDRNKPCWVLMSKGSTRPELTVTTDDERLPMRGAKLVLVEYEWGRVPGVRRAERRLAPCCNCLNRQTLLASCQSWAVCVMPSRWRTSG